MKLKNPRGLDIATKVLDFIGVFVYYTYGVHN